MIHCLQPKWLIWVIIQNIVINKIKEMQFFQKYIGSLITSTIFCLLLLLASLQIYGFVHIYLMQFVLHAQSLIMCYSVINSISFLKIKNKYFKFETMAPIQHPHLSWILMQLHSKSDKIYEGYAYAYCHSSSFRQSMREQGLSTTHQNTVSVVFSVDFHSQVSSQVPSPKHSFHLIYIITTAFASPHLPVQLYFSCIFKPPETENSLIFCQC